MDKLGQGFVYKPRSVWSLPGATLTMASRPEGPRRKKSLSEKMGFGGKRNKKDAAGDDIDYAPRASTRPTPPFITTSHTIASCTPYAAAAETTPLVPAKKKPVESSEVTTDQPSAALLQGDTMHVDRRVLSLTMPPRACTNQPPPPVPVLLHIFTCEQFIHYDYCFVFINPEHEDHKEFKGNGKGAGDDATGTETYRDFVSKLLHVRRWPLPPLPPPLSPPA